MKKKILYIMVGCPGSGKTYYAKNFAKSENINYVSRDEIRFSLLKDGEDYFSHESATWSRFVAAIRTALDETGSCIADATHWGVASRKKLVNALKCDNLDVIHIVMKTSLKTCLARNQTREGRARVPDSAIRSIYAQIEPPTINELPCIKEIKYVEEDFV